MDKSKIYKDFINIMDEENILIDEPMKNHTTFKTGGPADFLLLPQSVEEIKDIIKICREKKIPYYVIGNGSNLLVSDKGMKSVVIKISKNLSHVHIDGNTVIASAGVLLSTLSDKVLKESLTGLEFASGIPGTLGGAITMNAGAYDSEMKNVVKSCRVLDEEGNIIELSLDELELGYRDSIIQKRDYIVLEVTLELEKGDYDEIKAKIDEFTKRRTSKQPLHLPSSGSTFKRPVGYYAGKLIQDAGLKGFKIGGAQVSELHSGFIVNVDNATADDVLNLIKYIQKTVFEKFGVELEPEVRIIGEK